MNRDYTPLTLSQLENTLEAGPPENADSDRGYALVNVLPPDQFEREHIPGSINIPQEEIEEFDERFDGEKKIVVYCASPDCPASQQTAEALAERGFSHIYDFEGGLSEWKDAGNPVESQGTS